MPDVDEAMANWYVTARREWATLTGSKCNRMQPTFKWVLAPGPLTEESCNSSAVSVAWRAMGCKVDECAALLGRPEQGTTMILRHARKLAVMLEHWSGNCERVHP